MEYRSTNQRRRRILRDELRSSGSESDVVEGAAAGSNRPRAYGVRARRRFQRRTTDLFPKRWWSTCAVLTCVMAALAALVGLDWTVARWTDEPELRRALALGEPTGLATWTASMILALASLTCVQIFLLRRDRSDDYQGSHRVWLWVALLLVAASVEAVTNVSAVVLALIQAQSGWTLPFAAPVTVIGLVTLVGVGSLRLGIEMRRSRAAIAALLLATAVATGGILARRPTWLGLDAETAADVMEIAQLATVGFVLWMALLYVRFVYLEAHGLVRRQSRVAKRISGLVARRRQARAEKTKRAAQQPRTKTSRPAKPPKEKNSSAASPTRAQRSEDRAPSTATKPVAAAPVRTPATPSKSLEVPDWPAGSSSSSRAPPVTPRSTMGSSSSKRSDDSADDEPPARHQRPAPQRSRRDEADDDWDADESSNLSKSDRRRLRKLQRRQRREAA